MSIYCAQLKKNITNIPIFCNFLRYRLYRVSLRRMHEMLRNISQVQMSKKGLDNHWPSSFSVYQNSILLKNLKRDSPLLLNIRKYHQYYNQGVKKIKICDTGHMEIRRYRPTSN